MKHDFKESVAPECPPGFILRKNFKTKDGKNVPARCIEERGIFPKNMEGINEEKMKEVEKNIKKLCSREDCPKSCSKGHILRDGYLREAYVKKDGTRVEATLVKPECVKNQGKPGKGKKIGFISPDDRILSEHGYKDVKNLSLEQRRKALKKVIKAVAADYGERQALIYVIKALTFRATLTKDTSPNSSKAMTEDHKWASGLLSEWKEKHGDDKKDKKKKARLVLLGPTRHILAIEGYNEVKNIPEKKRHAMLRAAYRQLAKMKGEKEGYELLITELSKRAKMGMTEDKESSKVMENDAKWIGELFNEWKEKHPNKKGGKKGPITLNPEDHFLSEHGYKDVVKLSVEKRHAILKTVIRDLGKKLGQREGFRKLIEQLNAVSILQRTNDPASAKIFKADRTWVSAIYSEWKAKHLDKKGKKGLKLKLDGKKKKGEKLKLVASNSSKIKPDDKKKGVKLKLIKLNEPKSELIKKIEKLSKKQSKK